MINIHTITLLTTFSLITAQNLQLPFISALEPINPQIKFFLDYLAEKQECKAEQYLVLPSFQLCGAICSDFQRVYVLNRCNEGILEENLVKVELPLKKNKNTNFRILNPSSKEIENIKYMEEELSNILTAQEKESNFNEKVSNVAAIVLLIISSGVLAAEIVLGIIFIRRKCLKQSQ